MKKNVVEAQKVKKSSPKRVKKTKTCQKYRDGMFRTLFKEPHRFRELVNAIKGTNYGEDTVMEDVTLPDYALYKGVKNDVAFKIDGKIIVFTEHQSTDSPNIAARMLAYAYETYKPYLDPEVMHSPKKLVLPQPEFYVFYNGKDPFPPKKEVRLSDLYESSDKKMRHTLDLSVGIYNISMGNNSQLMKKSQSLLHYEIFVELVEGYEKIHGRDKAVDMAIGECMRRGILVEFLKIHKGKGIANMLFTELDQVKLRKIHEEYWMEEGLRKGMEKGMEKGMVKEKIKIAQAMRDRGIDLSTIAQVTELPMEEILKL